MKSNSKSFVPSFQFHFHYDHLTGQASLCVFVSLENPELHVVHRRIIGLLSTFLPSFPGTGLDFRNSLIERNKSRRSDWFDKGCCRHVSRHEGRDSSAQEKTHSV